MNRLFDALTLGPARRRRSMDRQLAALDAAYRSGSSWDPPRRRSAPGSSAPGRSGAGAVPGASPFRLLLVLLLVAAAVVGSVVGLRSLTGGTQEAAPAGPPDTGDSEIDRAPTGGEVPRDSSVPPPGVEASPTRLAPVVAPPPGSGGFVFTTRSETGEPVAYDPCRPLRYVIRAAGAPSGAARMVREAFAELGAATGLVFVDAGSTDEAPAGRAPYQPARYGERWAPILIAWSTPRETPDLEGTTTGTGGSQQVTVTTNGVRQTAFVTGSVVLDAPQLRDTDGTTTRAVLAHELGHVVGLNHVDDRSQLMYRESGLGISSYQDGDRRGLARLGAGPCKPTL